MMNYKLLITLLLLSSLLVVMGAIFKIMHWPFASFLLIIGQVSMLISFVYFLIKWTKKSQANSSHTN